MAKPSERRGLSEADEWFCCSGTIWSMSVHRAAKNKDDNGGLNSRSVFVSNFSAAAECQWSISCFSVYYDAAHNCANKNWGFYTLTLWVNPLIRRSLLALWRCWLTWRHVICLCPGVWRIQTPEYLLFLSPPFIIIEACFPVQQRSMLSLLLFPLL